MLSEENQVPCVTRPAQIACFADHRYRVEEVGLTLSGHKLAPEAALVQETTAQSKHPALNPDAMAAHPQGCGIDPINPAGRFEILLRLSATAGSASSSTVLAVHCSSGK